MTEEPPVLERASRTLDDVERGARVFAGRILVFEQVPAMHALCARSDRLITEAFGSLAPEDAQADLARAAFITIVAELQARYARDPATKALIANVLQETGADLGRTYCDRLMLRVQPHGRTHAGGRASTIGFHRDTWGSGIDQQVNWWAPVYALTHERTIAFYPHYWSRPLANSSGAWDFDELMARRRRAKKGEATDYPAAPVPSEAVDVTSELRVVIKPGDVLCFSSAHLHASVPNTSGRTRFSIEMRTVNADDVKAGRGAPNVDNAGMQRRTGWFRRIGDGRPLSEAVD